MKGNLIVILLALLLITSCSKDTAPFEFKEQAVNGKISNEAWNYMQGVARVKAEAPDTLNIGLYSTLLENPCTYAISEHGARFTIPNEVGIYKLRGGFSNRLGVTLYHSNKEFIALNGAIEIMSIDEENQLLEGRIDATYDDKNNINGYFTISYCTN